MSMAEIILTARYEVARAGRPLLEWIKSLKEEDKLAMLANGSGTNVDITVAPGKATPDDIEYVDMAGGGRKLEQGLTLFLAPHPSDASADFFAPLIGIINDLGGKTQQLMITRGEDGIDAAHKWVTAQQRKHEELRSAAITGVKTECLTTGNIAKNSNGDGYYFPDGKLFENIDLLTRRLKQYIIENKPARIGIPGLYVDHPDHIATSIAAIRALEELKKEGFFEKNGTIEVFTSDPEFGVAKGQKWAQDETIKQNKELPDLRKYEPEISKLRGNSLMAVPTHIIKLTEAQMQRQLDALMQHKSQVVGKPYPHLIEALYSVRGLQAGGEWGMGFYELKIPGVTCEPDQSILQSLPKGMVKKAVRV